MQLVIDVGNTRVKAAVFKNDTMLEQQAFLLSNFINKVAQFTSSYHIKKAIVSSVGRLNKTQLETVTSSFDTVLLSHKTPLPFINNYDTPETLGVDRIALVAAFVQQYPGKNGLIIDAGTCITFDFIDFQASYKGGAISPGLRLRYESLHNLTANLPLLEKSMPENIIGSSTETSIHSGVVNGVLKEIEGVINEYRAQYFNDIVIITGGDAQFLAERLKNSIFANSNFLLEGLNFILTYSND